MVKYFGGDLVGRELFQLSVGLVFMKKHLFFVRSISSPTPGLFILNTHWTRPQLYCCPENSTPFQLHRPMWVHLNYEPK